MFDHEKFEAYQLAIKMLPQLADNIALSKKYLHSIVCILSTIILK